MPTRRDSHGRFKTDHHARNAALGVTSAVVAVAAGVGAALRFGLLDRLFPADEGHDAPDLDLDLPRPGADARAPAAFRPDMDAPMTKAEREALRPATGSGPTLVADEGTLARS